MLHGVWFLLTSLKRLTLRHWILSPFGKTGIIQLPGFYGCPGCSVRLTSHASAMHPSGIISIYFWTQSFSTSTQKCSWMLLFFVFFWTLNIASLLSPPSFSKHFFFFSPSMFYQAVLEECTALLNIIVSPERAKATSPSLCNVLGKPIRFIAQNIFPFALQRSQTPAVSLSQRSLFLSLCLECVHTWLLCSYISWKRGCNQGVCGAKLSIECFWIQL